MSNASFGGPCVITELHVQQHQVRCPMQLLRYHPSCRLMLRTAVSGIYTSAKIGALHAPHFSLLLGCVKLRSYVLMHI